MSFIKFLPIFFKFHILTFMIGFVQMGQVTYDHEWCVQWHI